MSTSLASTSCIARLQSPHERYFISQSPCRHTHSANANDMSSYDLFVGKFVSLQNCIELRISCQLIFVTVDRNNICSTSHIYAAGQHWTVLERHAITALLSQ
jgi:hypothetical protein